MKKKINEKEQLAFPIPEEDPSCVFEPSLMADVILDAYLEKLGIFRLFRMIEKQENLSFDLMGYLKMHVYGRILTPLEQGYLLREYHYRKPVLTEPYYSEHDLEMLDIVEDYKLEIIQAIEDSLQDNPYLSMIFERAKDCFLGLDSSLSIQYKNIQEQDMSWVLDLEGYTEDWDEDSLAFRYKHRFVEKDGRNIKEIAFWDREICDLNILLESYSSVEECERSAYRLIETTDTRMEDAMAIKMMYAIRDLPICIKALQRSIEEDDPDYYESYCLLFLVSVTILYSIIWETALQETENRTANWLSLLSLDEVCDGLNAFQVEPFTPPYYRFRSMTFDASGRSLQRILLAHGIHLHAKLYSEKEVEDLQHMATIA